MTPQEIHAMLKQIRYDLSVTQTRVDNALKAVAMLPQAPAESHRCPECAQDYRSVPQLQSHRYHHHGGPLPDRDARADELAGVGTITVDAAANAEWLSRGQGIPA